MSPTLSVLSAILKPLTAMNVSLLWWGRQISWVLVTVMIAAIALQIFFRYVLNDALPWPEELARVMMIYIMALMTPSAYRWGGFVSIKMLMDALPVQVGRLLHLILMILSTITIAFMLYYAWKHFNSGFIFKSNTLQVPLAYMYFSMSICFTLLLSVNIELIIRILGKLAGGDDQFNEPVSELED